MPPRPTPREKRKPPKRLHKVVCPVVNQHLFDDEVNEDETVESLEDFSVVDEYQAVVGIRERFDEATSELVETSFLLEKTPPTRRPLEFTDYKRNYLTDSLFAGNIYVGSRASEGEEDNENIASGNQNEEKFASWRDNFRRKMSS